MGEVIDKAVERLGARLDGFEGRAKFVLKGEGTILADRTGVREGDGEADVTLTATVEDFRALLEGRLKPATAFMTGRLKVDGSMPMAMKLGTALS
ncbi:SCP2 sterol-binding domain-containing protein [Falsirhodobacter sp. 20TX0035]|uniref:SCP2 sterol-binding domain-containing protein n=1 Tax=Falsirhodobacter sp. 20TX0035 TaxID=3022019 RepID=UPI00232F3D31|nr:SCP2 sterol-binding domain-containing protein [Falsirhodobacter sp. 20TX0035]MDB6452104.1 SCP2 sterol-binding domain-containing protein [Falsirhodobacter sp. 20TX0035]